MLHGFNVFILGFLRLLKLLYVHSLLTALRRSLCFPKRRGHTTPHLCCYRIFPPPILWPDAAEPFQMSPAFHVHDGYCRLWNYCMWRKMSCCVLHHRKYRLWIFARTCYAARCAVSAHLYYALSLASRSERNVIKLSGHLKNITDFLLTCGASAYMCTSCKNRGRGIQRRASN